MKILDFFNEISPLLTALATIALVVVTIVYIWILNEQVKIQQDPILKINPTDHFIHSEIRGIFELCVYNTGVTDISNIRIFEDYFVAVQDNPIVLHRIGVYATAENQRIEFIKSGKNKKFQLNFAHLLDEFQTVRKDKEGGMKYQILRLKIRFNRDVDKKEFIINKYYYITYGETALTVEDQRGLNIPYILNFDEVKNILGE